MRKCVGSGWFSRCARAAALGAAALAGLAIAAFGLVMLGTSGGEDGHRDEIALAGASTGVLADEWTDRIQAESAWRTNRNTWVPPKNGRGKPSQLQGPPQQPAWFITPAPGNPWLDPPRDNGTIAPSGQNRSRGVSGYRTVCVRSCDGYFFPISYGTSESNFSRDQATCTNSCSGAKLYYYKTGTGDPEDMVDLSGQKYSQSKNADLFRTQYVESCKCKPHPWEQEATERHRIYALEDQRRKGNRAVIAELDGLKAKNKVDNRSSSRRRPADRRRDNKEEGSLKQSSPQVAEMQSPPTRSDVSRGQSGGGDRVDKPDIQTTGKQAGGSTAAALQPAGVVTGAVAAAASAATVQSVTSRATATAPVDAWAHRDPLQSAAIDAMPLAPAIDVSLPQPGEVPIQAPEPTEVQPAPPIPKASRSRRVRRDGAPRATRQAEVRRYEAPSRSRSDWTRQVFNP